MISLRVLDSISQIAAQDWDRLSQSPNQTSDPFTTHRFLSALERSSSVGADSGWHPRPLVLYQDERPVAALPLYVKSHSQGEYVFDQAWAQAYQQAGGDYYPKLQVAVPFTPVPGARFLGPAQYHATLLEGAIEIAQANGLSSLHITFCTEAEVAHFKSHPQILHRIGQQFHWQNANFRQFDDFLAALSSRKRKMIRKERDMVRSYNLDIQHLRGDAIQPHHWQAFWQFYQDTGQRKWGTPYLTYACFEEFHATMRDDILLVMAFEDGRPIAGALNFIAQDALLGRYWGAIVDYPGLHFELCYYQAIEWAIARGLATVQAGAQGDHKLARGYLPHQTHSLHWINNPQFRKAVANYLNEERQAVHQDIEILSDYSPFKK